MAGCVFGGASPPGGEAEKAEPGRPVGAGGLEARQRASPRERADTQRQPPVNDGEGCRQSCHSRGAGRGRVVACSERPGQHRGLLRRASQRLRGMGGHARQSVLERPNGKAASLKSSGPRGHWRHSGGDLSELATRRGARPHRHRAPDARIAADRTRAWPKFLVCGFSLCSSRLFREYGLPERIRTDNGTPFASRGVYAQYRRAPMRVRSLHRAACALFDLLFSRQLDVSLVDGEIHLDVLERSYPVAARVMPFELHDGSEARPARNGRRHGRLGGSIMHGKPQTVVRLLRGATRL
jgi:hypothetical protein